MKLLFKRAGSISAQALVIMIFLILTCLPLSTKASDEAESGIGEADNALNLAFEAVLEAEDAGANVSYLIFKMNMAADRLVEAKNAYRTGNFSAAVNKAQQCFKLLDDVADEAFTLKCMALAKAKITFSYVLILSFAGAAIFVEVLILIWTIFKHYYVRRLLKAKPEVASNVEA